MGLSDALGDRSALLPARGFDLVGPYVVCGGGAPDVFFVMSPSLPASQGAHRLPAARPNATATLLAAVGSRRDSLCQPDDRATNCVTSVIAFPPDEPADPGKPRFPWRGVVLAGIRKRGDCPVTIRLLVGDLARTAQADSGADDWLRRTRPP